MQSVFAAAIFLAIPTAIFANCVYDDTERKNDETWKNGGFEFKCIVLDDSSYTVEITGCVWARSGQLLALGDTVTVDNKTAKCFRDGDVIRFEERFEGPAAASAGCSDDCAAAPAAAATGGEAAGRDSSKTTTGGKVGAGAGAGAHGTGKEETKPDTPKMGGTPAGVMTKVENKCMFNGQSYGDGDEWRDGSFKYACATGDFGWKVTIVACFWDEETGGTGAEMKIGDSAESATARAKCYTDNEITYLNVTPVAKVTTAPTKAATKPVVEKPAEKTTTTTETKVTTPEKKVEKVMGGGKKHPKDVKTKDAKMAGEGESKTKKTADEKTGVKMAVEAKTETKVETDFSVDAKPVAASGYKASEGSSIKTVVDIVAPETGCIEKNVAATGSESATKKAAKPVSTKKTEEPKKTTTGSKKKSKTAGAPAPVRPTSTKSAGETTKTSSATGYAGTEEKVEVSSKPVAAKTTTGKDKAASKPAKKEETMKLVATGSKDNKPVMCMPTATPRAHGATWTEDGFEYECTVTGNRWKVDITACIWAANNDQVIAVDAAPVSTATMTATCTRGTDGTVYFEEKNTAGADAGKTGGEGAGHA